MDTSVSSVAGNIVQKLTWVATRPDLIFHFHPKLAFKSVRELGSQGLQELAFSAKSLLQMAGSSWTGRKCDCLTPTTYVFTPYFRSFELAFPISSDETVGHGMPMYPHQFKHWVQDKEDISHTEYYWQNVAVTFSWVPDAARIPLRMWSPLFFPCWGHQTVLQKCHIRT